jgi:hypothetical protein
VSTRALAWAIQTPIPCGLSPLWIAACSWISCGKVGSADWVTQLRNSVVQRREEPEGVEEGRRHFAESVEARLANADKASQDDLRLARALVYL